jgi:hypothetical protein
MNISLDKYACKLSQSNMNIQIGLKTVSKPLRNGLCSTSSILLAFSLFLISFTAFLPFSLCLSSLFPFLKNFPSFAFFPKIASANIPPGWGIFRYIDFCVFMLTRQKIRFSMCLQTVPWRNNSTILVCIGFCFNSLFASKQNGLSHVVASFRFICFLILVRLIVKRE